MSIPVPPPPPGPIPGFALPPERGHAGGKPSGPPPPPPGAKDKAGEKKDDKDGSKDGSKATSKPPAAPQPFKSSIHFYLFQRKPKHLLRAGESFSWEHVTRAEMGGMSKDEVEEELARYRRNCRKNGRNIAHDYAALTNHFRRRAIDTLLTEKTTNEKDPRAQWHLVALFLKKKRVGWSHDETVEMRVIIQRSEKQGVSVVPPPAKAAGAAAPGTGPKDEAVKNISKKPAKSDDSRSDTPIIEVGPAPLPPPPGGFRQPQGFDPYGPPPGPIRGPGGPWHPYGHQPLVDPMSRLNPFMPNLDTNEHSALPNPRKAPAHPAHISYEKPQIETNPPVQEIHNHYYGDKAPVRLDAPIEDFGHDDGFTEPVYESERDRITREFEGAPFAPKVQDSGGSQPLKYLSDYPPNTQRHRSHRAIEASPTPKAPRQQQRYSGKKGEVHEAHPHHQNYFPDSSTDSSVSIAGSSVFSRGGESEFTRASSPDHDYRPLNTNRRGSIHRTQQDRTRDITLYHEPVYRKHHKPRPQRRQDQYHAPTPTRNRTYRQPRRTRQGEYYDEILEAPRPPLSYHPGSRAVSPIRPPPLPRSYTAGHNSPALSSRIMYRYHLTHDSPNLDRLGVYDDYRPSSGEAREDYQQREAVRHMMRESRRRRSAEHLRHRFAYDYDQRRRGRIDDNYYP